MSEAYKALEQNLIDLIEEEQAKLGYRREDIRLYYPLSSLEHLLGIPFLGCTENNRKVENRNKTQDITGKEDGTGTEVRIATVKSCLSDFGEKTKAKLGGVKISNKGERFCFHIPKTGVEYVHEHMNPNEFIKELVELVGQHGCTIEQIKSLFRTKSEHLIIEKTDNGEFDWLIRFTDGDPDNYYYCFKDEGCHIIYHRFLPADYEDLGL